MMSTLRPIALEMPRARCTVTPSTSSRSVVPRRKPATEPGSPSARTTFHTDSSPVVATEAHRASASAPGTAWAMACRSRRSPTRSMTSPGRFSALSWPPGTIAASMPQLWDTMCSRWSSVTRNTWNSPSVTDRVTRGRSPKFQPSFSAGSSARSARWSSASSRSPRSTPSRAARSGTDEAGVRPISTMRVGVGSATADSSSSEGQTLPSGESPSGRWSAVALPMRTSASKRMASSSASSAGVGPGTTSVEPAGTVATRSSATATLRPSSWGEEGNH